MKFSREAKRGFGKASVSLLAITLMTLGPIAGARAEQSIDELMGASAEKVSNKELAEQRGGFLVRGMMFNIAVEKRKTVNGELEYSSRLVADQDGWRETVYDNARSAAAAGNDFHHGATQGSTGNNTNSAAGTPPSGNPVETPTFPVVATGDSSLGASNVSGLGGGAAPGTGSGGTDAGAAIMGGVELVVDAVSPPEVPDVTSAVANNVPDTSGGNAILAPQAPTIPGELSGAIPGTDVADVSGAGSLPLPTTENAAHAHPTNAGSAGVAGVGDIPQSTGTSVMPAAPGHQNVQILAGNQTLTNETVRRLLFGPTVVVNDKNNVVIQEYTSITVDIANFSSITADAIRGHLAASIADLIRTQTANSLTGF